MITEDVLEGMLAELAQGIDVPPNGARDALLQVRRVEAGVAEPYRRSSLNRSRFLGVAVGLAAVLTLGIVVTSHHAATSESSGSKASAGVAVPAAAASTAAAATSAASGASPQAVPTVDADRIVKTGSANVVVPKGGVQKALDRIGADAKGLGGFVQDSTTDGGTATVTYRVPVANFETLLADLSKAGTVTSSQSTAKDVTAQYVDLAARLKALETSRSTYLTILSEAKTVNDTLSIQQRLDGIEQQIEELQGQENDLDAQASYSTLAVTVAEATPPPAPAPKPVQPQSGLSLAFHHAWDHFRGGTEDVISASGTIALLVIAGLVALLAYRLGRTVYRRRSVMTQLS